MPKGLEIRRKKPQARSELCGFKVTKAEALQIKREAKKRNMTIADMLRTAYNDYVNVK